MIGPLAANGIQVLILTGSTDEASTGAALDAGAVSILHKGESLDQLCENIRDVIDGHAVMRPARRDELLQLADAATRSKRNCAACRPVRAKSSAR